MFGLMIISKQNLKDKLCAKLYKMALSKERLKKKWDSGEITEWTYYKKYWNLIGRLYMLEDLIKSI